MWHEDTTYIEDEGLSFVVLEDDGESEGVLPVTVTAGGRQWSYSEAQNEGTSLARCDDKPPSITSVLPLR